MDYTKKGFKIVNPEWDEKAFKRNAIIELASNNNTPEDIVENTTVGDFEICNYNLYWVTGKADINYSLELGFDVKEDYYDATTKQVKTKTVTDWRFYKGSAKKESEVQVDNMPMTLYYGDNYEEIIEANKSNVTPLDKDDWDIDSECLESAKKACKDKAYESVKQPSSKQRNVSYEGIVDVRSVKMLEVPVVERLATYKGQNFLQYNPAFAPYKDYDKTERVWMYGIPDEEKTTIKAGTLATLPLLILAVLLTIVGIAMVICQMSTILAVALIAVGWIVRAIFAKIYRDNVKKQKLEKKKRAVKKYLKDNNLGELREDEEYLFTLKKKQGNK